MHSVGGFQNFLGVFGEGGDSGMVGHKIGGTYSESSLSSFSNLTLSSRKGKK